MGVVFSGKARADIDDLQCIIDAIPKEIRKLLEFECSDRPDGISRCDSEQSSPDDFVALQKSPVLLLGWLRY